MVSFFWLESFVVILDHVAWERFEPVSHRLGSEGTNHEIGDVLHLAVSLKETFKFKFPRLRVSPVFMIADYSAASVYLSLTLSQVVALLIGVTRTVITSEDVKAAMVNEIEALVCVLLRIESQELLVSNVGQFHILVASVNDYVVFHGLLLPLFTVNRVVKSFQNSGQKDTLGELTWGLEKVLGLAKERAFFVSLNFEVRFLYTLNPIIRPLTRRSEVLLDMLNDPILAQFDLLIGWTLTAS